MPVDILHKHAATDGFNYVEFDDSTVFILSQTMNVTTTLRFICFLFCSTAIVTYLHKRKLHEKKSCMFSVW